MLNRTFVHFMYLCARLNICAFKTPPWAIPKPLPASVKRQQTKRGS